MTKIKNNISLKPFNTFGIEVKAKQFAEIHSFSELNNILTSNHNLPLFILGGGSNMLLTKDVQALVLHIKIKGITIESEDEDFAIVKANAGENWHQFVLWCIENNLGGVENLSLIPGNVGTAPIQNIGAYGVELKDVFVSCDTINIEDKTQKTFFKSDCHFGYRESVFKQEQNKGKYIITSVRFKLSKKNHKLNINYGAITSQLQAMGIVSPTIKDVSNAVIAIRQSKLPDPKKIGNSGSFFKNPIITKSDFERLKTNFPNIPSYTVSENQIKIPAGWLIEQAGFKGKTFNNYGVHEKQALVLVNYGEASGKDIYNLSLLIKKTIKRLFGIDLETEVNIF